MSAEAKRASYIDKLSADVTERFDAVDWNSFNAPDKTKRTETQTQVLQIRNDLLTVAAVDPTRAAKIWDEHVPLGVPRPNELPKSDTAPEGLHEAAVGRGRRKARDPETLATAAGDLLSAVSWNWYNDERPEYRNLASADRARADKVFDRLLERDPLRAAKVWDENVPDFVARPFKLRQMGPVWEPDRVNAIEAGRRRRRVQPEPYLDASTAAAPKPSDDGRASQAPSKTAKAKPSRAAGPEASQATPAANRGPPDADPRAERTKMLLAGLERRFLKADGKYHFRDGRQEVAFHAQDRKLATAYDTPAIVTSMVDLAEARGWSSLKLTGTEAFRREAWLQAGLRDFEVSGYSPTKLDKARLEALRAERGLAAPTNEMAPPQKAARRAEMAAKFEQVIEDGIPEARLPLMPAQDQHLRLMEATMRHRGDAPAAIARARELAQAKLTRERVHVGTLVEVGSAPYQDKPGQALSHYVLLQDEQGERSKVWGVDLPRALKASGAEPGQKVAVAFRGRQPVTVNVPINDRHGDTLRVEPRVVDRNTWEVVPFDRLRPDVKASIARALDRQNNPANVRVFDRQSAPSRAAVMPSRPRDRGADRERSL